MWNIDLFPALVVLGAVFAPAAVLLGLLTLQARRERAAGLRAPVAAHRKLLRAPGETLRRELEQLDEQLNEEFAALFFIPLVTVGVLAMAALRLGHPLSWPQWVGSGVGATVPYAWAARRLWRLRAKRRRVRFGFSGERAVGEELNQLVREGWWVFHDLPADELGNIDHVLVGPRGVYAVETKTRRKRAKPARREGPAQRGPDPVDQVTYDGQRLAFGANPAGGDSRAVAQARRQACWLGDWLAKATGEPVPVWPVLVLPGWYVKRQGPAEVCVINPAEIRGALGKRAVLSPEQVTRVCHQLETRCRDVEF